MQWNQPFRNYQHLLKTVPPTPQIVGEGDVTAITFPDGSVQFYFAPVFKQSQPVYPFRVTNPDNPFSNPTNGEVWFVRTIVYPQTNFNIASPYGYLNTQCQREFPPFSPPNYFVPAEPPPYNGYTQKFHNDASTSSTDLHYFYPSIRPATCLQYCTKTQTEAFYPNEQMVHDCGRNRLCDCESYAQQKPVNIENKCFSQGQTKLSESCMSVDGELGQSKCKKHKKIKNNSRHTCECKEMRHTSDKYVTTCIDQAIGNTAISGQETQTIAKRPKKQKPQQPKVKLSSSSQSCCFSDGCTCTTSETERR